MHFHIIVSNIILVSIFTLKITTSYDGLELHPYDENICPEGQHPECETDEECEDDGFDGPVPPHIDVPHVYLPFVVS